MIYHEPIARFLHGVRVGSCWFGVFFFLIFSSCAPHEASRAEFALGTVCTITLFERGLESEYEKIFLRILEIENRMSVNIPASDVARVNKAAGIEPVIVHEEVFFVIERALRYAQISGGAFDPTVGPLVSLWGIGTDKQRVPSQAEIDEVLPLVNWRDVELDAAAKSVFLKKRGMALDLGAIAKGHAADAAASYVKKNSCCIERAIIDLGGNIAVCGVKKDKSPWKVGIQNPNKERGAYLGIAQVHETSVVTSGVYERFFEKDGHRYHHIFSPQTGYPVDNELLSVTIIAASSIDADALSTTVFVLGFEKGLALLQTLSGVEAVFVFNDLTVRKTFSVDFTLTDEDFRIVE